MSQRSVTLHCTKGGSDKIYKMQLVEIGSNQWQVKTQRGRRVPQAGCFDIHGIQTKDYPGFPVPFHRAEAEWDRLFAEKRGKGYRVVDENWGDGAVPAISQALETSEEKEMSDVDPLLLTQIDKETAMKLIRNPAYWMQIKKDGWRNFVRRRGGMAVTGINRKGEVRPVTTNIEIDALAMNHNFTMDGEEVNTIEWAFDLLDLDGEDWRKKPYSERYAKLSLIVAPCSCQGIELLPVAKTTAEKQAMWDFAEANKEEGLVFKMASAPYDAGRSKRYFKFKFKDRKTFLVTEQNGTKRSVAIACHKDGQIYPIGNVTVPVNKEIPPAGALLDVEYLYAFPNGGSLFQPVFIGVRMDITDYDDYSMLKFKQGTTEQDEEA